MDKILQDSLFSSSKLTSAPKDLSKLRASKAVYSETQVSLGLTSNYRTVVHFLSNVVIGYKQEVVRNNNNTLRKSQQTRVQEQSSLCYFEALFLLCFVMENDLR